MLGGAGFVVGLATFGYKIMSVVVSCGPATTAGGHRQGRKAGRAAGQPMHSTTAMHSTTTMHRAAG